MRNWVLVSLLLTACEDPVQLTRCGSPCYSGPEGTANVGICHPGQLVCTSSGTVVGCEGEITPRVQYCRGEGLDSDCNGLVDDSDPQVDFFCGNATGQCRPGRYQCVAGSLTCVGGVGPQEERCGVDADCDGIVGNIPLEFCYTGTPSELIVPATGCRPGVVQCRGYTRVCAGEQLPGHEVCTIPGLPPVDEDCNGSIDDVLPFLPPYADFVVGLDRSGSMGDRLQRVGAALGAIARANPTHRWYLFDIPEYPEPYGVNVDCAPRAPDGFYYGCDSATASAAFSRLSLIGGAQEPTLDFIYDVLSGAARVAWRPLAGRVLLVFGDEPAQSLRHLGVPDIQRVLYSGIMVVVWTDVLYQHQYRPFASVYDLGLSPEEIAGTKFSWSATACQ